MYYCVASMRKLSGNGTQEFVRYAKGITKGNALIELFKSGGIIIWFEELSQDDYELLENARIKGEFMR